MNTPAPTVPRPDPTTPGASPAPSAAGSAVLSGLVGTPLAVVTVWGVQTWLLPHGQTLDPTSATVIGGLGTAVFGYLAQIARAVLQLLQEKAIARS
jgi:hypothetical protein